MSELTKDDLRLVLSRLPKDVIGVLKNNPQIILAGGYIRATIAGETPADIDLTGASEADTARIAGGLVVQRIEARETVRKHVTNNAITILSPPRLPVQFITRWSYGTAEECASSFDFTICAAAIKWSKNGWESWAHPQFYTDLAARRLRYLAPARDEDAGGSMLRVIKYIQRGYNIQIEALAGVCARLVVGIETGQLPPGMRREEMYRSVIKGLLREVDPLNVVDGVDVEGDEHHGDVS